MLTILSGIFFGAALAASVAVFGLAIWRDRRAILAALFGLPKIEVEIATRPLTADEHETLRRALKRSVIVRKVLRRDA